MHLWELERSPHYVHSTFSCLRAFFNWCVEEELIDRSPMRNMKPPKLPFIGEKERDQLLHPCPASIFLGARNGAISLADLGLTKGLEVASILELETTLSRQSIGGLVFDYYGPDNFKFAVIDVNAGKAVIGHYTEKSGCVYDATFDIAIQPGVEYNLALSLKGTTVSLSVKESGAKGWQAIVGYVFNAVTVDGGFGLLSKDGTSSFDAVTVKTDDPAFRE